MAADPCDLTTVANVKTYLTKTDTNDDTLLQLLVTAASRRIATEIAGDQGNILRQAYTDVVNGKGGTSLYLANRPVVSVSAVTINGVPIPQQTFLPWQPATTYSVGDQRLNGGNAYACTVPGVSAASGGPAGTAADIVDGTVHWTFLQAGGGNGWALTNDRIQLVGYVFGDPTAIGYGYGWGYDYSRPGIDNVVVSYVAGFDPAAIPADLAFAAIEAVAWFFKGKDHIGLVSRTVGGEPVQYQGTWATEQSQGGLPASVLAVCRQYKPPRV